MWIAVELIIMPVMLISAIIIIGILDSFSFGSIALALVIFVTIFVSVRGLFRFVWRVEHDEGVEAWEESPTAAGAEQKPASPEPVATQALVPTPDLDLVDECGDESFPASDPPSWTLGSVVPSNRPQFDKHN